MSLPPRLDAALQRLASALDQLEAAAERRQKADAARGDLEEELAVMQDDRSRMAVDLDAALARNKALAHANSEVQRRLTRVSSTIQSLLPDDASGEQS
jgi:hypothetical protein